VILKKSPNARLIVAGGNHPAAAGYWESIRATQSAHLPIEFLGYIPQKDVAQLFRTSSLLVMPYDSSTGSSGPAHQACEYGLPIVCADIADFRCMSVDDDMAIIFYKPGDAADLAAKIITVLESPEVQHSMSNHNYEAGVQMAMTNVARTYIRWFELHKLKREIRGEGLRERVRARMWNALYGPGHRMSLKRRNQTDKFDPKDDAQPAIRNPETAPATIAAMSLKHQVNADK
jgi:glycosyltransferase involved in cell wall biosynthesis